MRTVTPIPERRRAKDTTPSAFEGKLSKVGDITTRSVFCLFPTAFIVRNPTTQKRERVSYWLETIEVREMYITFGFSGGYGWKAIAVNGQVCV